MSENSKIEWCDHTFNPWWGCVKVSPGCKNCYAAKGRGAPYWGMDAPRRFMKDSTWENPVKWNEKAEKLGIRHKVFCGSMCDVFEDRRDLDAPRRRLIQLITDTPNLDWLLLTKRPENVVWPIISDNVWLGTSVENQEMADLRIPELLKIPAKVRFLSCEPLLGEIDLQSYLHWGISWCIIGAESGHRRRPMKEEWVLRMVDDCKKANVPVFYKQKFEGSRKISCPPINEKPLIEFPQITDKQKEN